MYHLAQHHALPSRLIPSLVIVSSIAVPTSPAYAVTLDEVPVLGIPGVPTFALGFAAGAIMGGLAVGLMNRSSKRQLREEIDEVMRVAERAEDAARRAEARLEDQARENARRQVEEQSTGVLDRAPSAPVSEAVVAYEAKSLVNKPSKEKEEQRRAERRNKGVQTLLQERLGSNVFNEMPVISRGAERAATEPIFIRTPRPKLALEPSVRAAVIDRRIPHFDESLYPDTTADLHHNTDMFETAMRAMEDSLSAVPVPAEAAPAQADQPTADLERIVAPSASVATPSDASSHIDDLIQDEMERNRSGSARRYSRAHLTMIDGTGDLNAVHKSSQYRPRHMQVASKEA